MQPNPRAANPFALLLDPQAVLSRMEQCESLSKLQRRVCRPLDKPLLGPLATSGAEVAEFDQAIDDTSEAAGAEDSANVLDDGAGGSTAEARSSADTPPTR